MVKIKKEGSNFIFEIEGIHKLWSLQSRLTIPAKHIIRAYPDNQKVYTRLGIRMPGTNLPGIIQAGAFIGSNGVIFCDHTTSSKCIVIELKDDHYQKLIIDVEEPKKAIEMLK